jgi:uncharacterized membrane protein HdeD (DUF308 family)
MNAVKPVARGRGIRKAVETEYGFSWKRANTVVLGLGIVMLVAGYVALSRGSITLAPILLVLGYCGLIPAALLIRARAGESGE